MLLLARVAQEVLVKALGGLAIYLSLLLMVLFAIYGTPTER